MSFATPGWDLALLRVVNTGWADRGGPALDALMLAASQPAMLYGAAALLTAWVALRRGLRAGGAMLLAVAVLAGAVGLSDLSCNLIKDRFGRLRPYQALAGVRHPEDGGFVVNAADFLPDRSDGASYPSGHAANTMVVCALASVLWPRRRLWRLLWAPPLVTGLSRVYLGVHYPSDVLAGWGVGLCVALALGAALTWARTIPEVGG